MSPPRSLSALSSSPSAGFGEPFEMLSACHERMERMLALAGRMRDHVRQHGADSQAQQAARDVMRYFDQAAPQHHRDEELHVFPRLLARPEGSQRQLVARLLADHRAMEEGWPAARAALAAVAAGQPLDAAAQDALERFAGLHFDHLRAEDDLIYPAARSLLDASAQAAMGAEMAARRGVAFEPPAVAAAPPSGGAPPKTAEA